MKSKLIVIAAVALALGGCNRQDADSQSQYTHLTGGEAAVTTPPATPDRGPVPPDANTAAPGTDASVAFAAGTGDSEKVPPSKAGTPESHVEIAAQDAAAKAPDTAAADAEKRRVHAESANAEAAPGNDVVAAAPVGTPLPHEESPRQQ